jgi:acetyl-CoA acetyltransferase
VNRQCASGLQAIASSIAGIKEGHFQVVIAGGMEKMSEKEIVSQNMNTTALKHKHACGCYLPMGITSEVFNFFYFLLILLIFLFFLFLF